MSVTRIVAAILDTHQLVLYKEDGETIEIPQGDVRVKRIIDEVTTPLSTNGWADVEIGYPEEVQNHYAEFEGQTSGVVRFFRVAKKFVKNLFNPATDAEPVAPVALGQVPVPGMMGTPDPLPPMKPIDTKAESVPEKIQDATQNQKPTLTSAVDQIMANAKPVTDPGFNTEDHNSVEDTMIAVVTTPTGPAIIPGVENLSNQMRVASKLGSTMGVQKFLERLGAVIDKRGHSVQELLNFMSRGDLPIADDGSIIGYKVLRSTAKNGGYLSESEDPMPVPPKGYYVDCHSGRVLQRVGSYVTQKNVDESRRTQCSTGLHIARRAYLRGFPGDVITLVKIAPEDVMAVPSGEPDKMRARGYHIIAEIPAEEHERLRCNQPIEGMMAKRMLGMAIKGQHIDILEDVVIGGDKGNGLQVTPRKGVAQRTAPAITSDAPVAEALPDPEQKIGYTPVDAKAVSEAVISNKAGAPGTMSTEEVAKQEEAVSVIAPIAEAITESEEPVVEPAPVAPLPATGSGQESRADKIKRLIDVLRGKGAPNTKVDAARELIAIGKGAKKSLSKLNVSDADVNLVNQWAQQEGAAKTVPTPKPVPTKTMAQATKPKPQESKKAVVEAAPSSETRSEKAMRLFKAKNWFTLFAHKKAVKVGWEKLGFTGQQIEQIIKNDPTKK